MIKYNLNNINDWNFGEDNIIKVYRNNAVCYYKITSGDTPTPVQEPCFAVVDNISQYSETEFEDVFNLADDKWYKLNNLNQYEEYGIYGSGRTVTTYEGKLTVDDGYEYMYSGGSWVNVGEVSGSTATLPDVSFVLNYNAKDYDATTHSIPQTSGQTKGIDAIQNYGSNTIVDHSADGYISVTGNTRLAISGGTTPMYRTNTQTGCTMTIVSKVRTDNVNQSYSVLTCRGRTGGNQMNWMWRYPTNGIFLHGSSSYNSVTYYTTTSASPITASVRVSWDGSVKQQINDWTNNGSYSGAFQYGSYSSTVNSNGSLFCDYLTNNGEFWKGDFYWVYMSQEVLTDDQVQQVIAYNEGGGGQTEYPLEYVVREDPPDNLTFTSMEEAEEYECPWVGMKAKIDGDNYVFSGDSQSGYEWVYQASRLPIGYTEVEYVENKNNAYIDTGFKPNQDTRIVATMQTVTSTSYGRFFGCGGYDKVNAMQFDYENGATGTLHISWGHIAGWTTYSSCVGDYNKHTYDWDKNYFYRDKGETNQFSASTTYTNFQCQQNLSVFMAMQSSGPDSGQALWKGKLFDFKVYDNGTLIRDLVPCIRDNDNTVGAYDIVNDVFYYPPNYSSYPLVAGPEVE